jgi:hypothetical protein
MVTMVRVVGRFRLRTPLAFHLRISPLTASGRRNRASLASRPEKSVTLRHRQRADHEVQENMWWHWGGGGGGKKNLPFTSLLPPDTTRAPVPCVPTLGDPHPVLVHRYRVTPSHTALSSHFALHKKDWQSRGWLSEPPAFSGVGPAFRDVAVPSHLMCYTLWDRTSDLICSAVP